jgi:hypothetical protein
MLRKLLASLALSVLAAGPAGATLIETASDTLSGPLGACAATDGGTGSLAHTCSSAGFSAISMAASGDPLLPQPDLSATELTVTSGAITGPDTLTVDISQAGLSFPGGNVFAALTVNALIGGAGPVTLSALGPGGATEFTETFLGTDSATSGVIPVGPATNDAAEFIATFTAPGQSVDATIELIGVAVAEPSTLLLLAGAFLGLIFLQYRRAGIATPRGA